MLKKTKDIFKKIREFIWPLLEKLEPQEIKLIGEDDCKWSVEETDFLLEYIEKYNEDEEKRRNQVESKATIFIGIFGVVITVLLTLVKTVITEETSSKNNSITIVVISLAIIYLCRAIWFAIKTLERCSYASLGFPRYMLNNECKKKRKIIINYYNNIKKNQEKINLKVDYMTMAQEYFKRAIVVVIIFSSMLLIKELVIIYKHSLIELKNMLYDMYRNFLESYIVN